MTVRNIEECDASADNTGMLISP